MRRSIWTTRDGRTIAVKDMTITHVINTVLMLRRRSRARVMHEYLDRLVSYAQALSQVHGDGAYDAISQEMDVLRIEPVDDAIRRGVPCGRALLKRYVRDCQDIVEGEILDGAPMHAIERDIEDQPWWT